MKKILLTLCFLLIYGNTYSANLAEKEVVEKNECYYVYMANREDCGNEKGDVIDVLPCSRIIPPKHDFNNFNIIKMSLTKTEAEELKAPLIDGDKNEEHNVIKPRKYKIDIMTLTEKKEYTKDEISSKITIKSAVFSINK